jgi:hypothetical protein
MDYNKAEILLRENLQSLSEKPDIVLKANFIINYRSKFTEIHKKLSADYNVFVSDIFIKERILWIDYKV